MNMLIAQIKRYYISAAAAAARAAAKEGELAARAYYNQSGSERGGRYEGRVACQHSVFQRKAKGDIQ
jgi:hypothetical protein